MNLGLPAGILMLFLTIFLASCGGGWTSIGNDIDYGPICVDRSGQWEAKTDQGRTISLTVLQDECLLTGLVGYLPCVPATPFTGTPGILGHFGDLDSDDGSLIIRRASNPDPTSIYSINAFRFTNTQNRPNCPASESGSIVSWRQNS